MAFSEEGLDQGTAHARPPDHLGPGRRSGRQLLAHCGRGHGITREEVEEVLRDPTNPVEGTRTTRRSITFGWTSTGQHIAVVWQAVSTDPPIAYPVTAFPAP